MKILVIDYGGGNVESVANALRAITPHNQILISADPTEIKSASHLILPGVGAFGDCMAGIKSRPGLLPELAKQVLTEKKPLLGICVGMQVLASVGYENGEHQGLGFIPGHVGKISAPGLKIPHMGWNNISIRTSTSALLDGIKNGEHFYFANSYHFICDEEKDVLAEVEYGSKLAAIIARGNIFGVQFHPEKSGEAGLRLMKNFLNVAN